MATLNNNVGLYIWALPCLHNKTTKREHLKMVKRIKIVQLINCLTGNKRERDLLRELGRRGVPHTGFNAILEACKCHKDVSDEAWSHIYQMFLNVEGSTSS